MVRVTQGAQRSLALSPRCLWGFGAAVGAAGGGTWGQAPGSATRGNSRAGPASAMNTPLQTWARRRGWQHHRSQRCSCAQHRCQKIVSPWPPLGGWHGAWSGWHSMWSKCPGAPGPIVRPVPTPNWVPPAGVFFPGWMKGLGTRPAVWRAEPVLVQTTSLMETRSFSSASSSSCPPSRAALAVSSLLAPRPVRWHRTSPRSAPQPREQWVTGKWFYLTTISGGTVIQE